MEAVLEHYGVRYPHTYTPTGWRKVSCPSDWHAHGDRNPSASVHLGIGRFVCFGCTLRGDGFDLMLELEDMQVLEVLKLFGGEKMTKKEESDWLL